MNLSYLIRLAGDTVGTTAAGKGEQVQELTGFAAFFYQYGSILMLVLVFALMYFFMIRPQKKREKEEQKMRNNLRVGDELVTIGGICGRVVSLKDDTITIESGADRTKIQFKKSAIQTVLTKHDDPVDDDDDDDDI